MLFYYQRPENWDRINIGNINTNNGRYHKRLCIPGLVKLEAGTAVPTLILMAHQRKAFGPNTEDIMFSTRRPLEDDIIITLGDKGPEFSN